MNLRVLLFGLLIAGISCDVFAQGEFWGTARGSDEGLFKTDASGKNMQIMHKFDFTNHGKINNGHQLRMLEASNGLFYGITFYGGKYDKGVIFEFSETNNSYRVLHHFNDTGGANPSGSLMQATNGKLYGTTLNGGTSGGGVIYEFDISTEKYTLLWNFVISSGSDPSSMTMVEGDTGKLYGSTSNGGTNNNGVIFVYDLKAAAYTRLASFTSTTGTRPRGALWQFRKDTLYGSTLAGGINNAGTLFLFDIKNSKISKLYDLNYPTGATSTGEFYLHNNNTIIGICQSNAANTMGAVFEFNIVTRTFQKTFDFSSTYGGVYPLGGLVAVAPGKLLGIFQEGYSYIYDISTKKISFQGNGPYTGTPTISSKSKRIFAHCAGEATGNGYVDGSIAEIDTLNNKRISLIQMNIKDGKSPNSELLFIDTNRIFGTTFSGGHNDAGLMFEYARSTGKYTIVWHNGDTVPIANPLGNLVLSKRNNRIYGYCNTQGVIELDPTTYEKHKFSGGAGDNNAGLFQTRDSNIYLLNQSGILEKLDLVQRKTTSYLLIGGTVGNSVYYGPLIADANDIYYGVNFSGGSNGFGCIYSVNIATKNIKTVYDFDGNPLKNPASDLRIHGDSLLFGRLANGNIFMYNLISGVIKSYSFGSGADLLLAMNLNIYASVNTTGIRELNTTTLASQTTSSWPATYNIGSQSRLSEICFTPACGPVSGTSIVCTDSSIHEFSVPDMDSAIHFQWKLPKGAFFADKDTASRKVKIGFSALTDTNDIVVTPINQCPGKPSKFTITPSPSIVYWTIALINQAQVIGKTFSLETININPICHKAMQFSWDSGKTYITLKNGLDYADSLILWKVPDTESDHCFLRVVGQNPGKYWTSPEFRIISPLPFKAMDFLGEYNAINANPQNPENAVNKGQFLRFKAQIKNNQPGNLLTLKGILRTSDTNIVITDSAGAFNNILAGKKGWSVDEYEIYIKPACPDNHVLKFDLRVTDQNDLEDPWTSRNKIQFPVNVMDIPTVVIDDDNTPDSKGDNDDIIESGEVIEALPLLRNKSPWQFNKPVGRLSSSENFLRIWNDTNGASGKVYHTWRYNAPGGNHQALSPFANNIAPEQDYVFTYLANATYSMNFFMTIDCYLTDFKVEDPNGTIAMLEPKIRYGIPYQMNKGYSNAIESPEGKQLLVYPNPCDRNLFIVIPADIAPATLVLCNIAGQQLRIFDLRENVSEWPILNFPNGLYFLKLIRDNQTISTQKLIIHK